MAIKQVLTLLSNAAATSAAFIVGIGGFYSFAIQGTWAGATAKLQMLGPDGATYMDIDSTLSFTANGVQGVDLPTGATVRVTITGGPPSAVYASLSLIRQ